MPVYDFELVLSRPFFETELDALFKRTRGQVTVGYVRDGTRIDREGQAACVWEASSLAGAIMDVVGHVEASAAGVQTLRVETDPLLSIAEIAERVGRTEESVRLAVKGTMAPARSGQSERGVPFPAAEKNTPRHRLWRWSVVAQWYGVNDPQVREAEPTARAVNGWLALREVVPEIAPDPRALVTALGTAIRATA